MEEEDEVVMFQEVVVVGFVGGEDSNLEEVLIEEDLLGVADEVIRRTRVTTELKGVDY